MVSWVCWMFSIINVVGTVMNVRKMYFCFFIWSVCNVFWLYLDIVTGQYARIILDVINLATSLYGLFSWYKDSRTNKEIASVISETKELKEFSEDLLLINDFSYFLDKSVSKCLDKASRHNYSEISQELNSIKKDSSYISNLAKKCIERLKKVSL